MKVDGWSAVPVRHTNLDPDWHYAGRDVPVLPGLRVALRAGDVIGEGFAPFLPHLDASPEALEATGRRLAARQVGLDLSDLDGCLAALGPCRRDRNAARSAVEMALLDLAARSRGRSVAALLGGTPRAVDVLRIIPVKAPDRMARIAAMLTAEGYRALKLKATGNADDDIARVRAVRRAVGPRTTLIVDANQAYDPKGAVRLEVRLRGFGVWSLEQPVPCGDAAALRSVRTAAETLIEADEGLFAAPDIAALLDAGAVDGITLKLARSGGLLPSLAMARAAGAAGAHARLGTAFGGPLVALATATLAALCPVTGPAECAEFRHFDDRDHDWPVLDGGRLAAPTGPGFGQVRRTAWTGAWT